MTRRSGVTLIEMMIVVTIIALMTGVAYPSIVSGLASVRLTSAAGEVSSFLTSSMNRVERHEQAAAIVIFPKENRMARYTVSDVPDEVLELPAGVMFEGEEARRIVLQPGGTVPRVEIDLRNEKGSRRAVLVDPVTAVTTVQRLDEVAK